MHASTTVTVVNCPHCGGTHGVRCPEVKAVEYHPDGTIKRVEFLTPADRGPMLGGAAGIVTEPTFRVVCDQPQPRIGARGGMQ